MNVLLSGKQTSGYDWNTRGGSRLYHRQRFNSPRMPGIQLAELAHLVLGERDDVAGEVGRDSQGQLVAACGDLRRAVQPQCPL